MLLCTYQCNGMSRQLYVPEYEHNNPLEDVIVGVITPYQVNNSIGTDMTNSGGVVGIDNIITPPTPINPTLLYHQHYHQLHLYLPPVLPL